MIEPTIYHVGCLAIDRQADPELDRRAAALLKQAEAGEVILVQRRVAPDRYEYLALAVARRRDAA